MDRRSGERRAEVVAASSEQLNNKVKDNEAKAQYRAFAHKIRLENANLWPTLGYCVHGFYGGGRSR